ncbi:sigma-70 family RNA polymerase sigma factor [Lacticaseibacillus porcinae]|uniref:sigma-70 family RNA polymerase sigma factor n=1 Tax=Lacticaseibacillus porcinae TaxID=1123687 RepID=UPI000F7B2557|nr:sigma-70 family RNA polymerase sigma factor [Lacticaseibacillus porcinae]
MKPEVKVDDQVIIEVLAQFEVKWGDPDFDELLLYARLRYLHYQHQAASNGLSPTEFERSVQFALLSDVWEYLIVKLGTTVEQQASQTTEMGKHYRFVKATTLEEQSFVDQLVQGLPKRDQAMIGLFRDGLSQREIAAVLGMGRSAVMEYATELKQIYARVKGE